ncbi:MAG TPA: hypothetical protein ENL02_01555 [Epsilonproteobacteria bacterium]|nr:hypothetical protein [Campylobacterota bacterium]
MKRMLFTCAIALGLLTGCGGSNDKEENPQVAETASCSFTQVGQMSDNNATVNVKCTNGTFTNTENLSSAVVADGDIYKMSFQDGSVSVDENITIV